MKALYKNNELITILYTNGWVSIAPSIQVSPPVVGWNMEHEGDFFDIREYTPPPPPVEEPVEETEEE